MRQPITLSLLLPILFLCLITLGDTYWGFGFIVLATLSFILEIKIRKGNLSKNSITEFFTTPIKPRGLVGKSPALDTSPKVSMSYSLLFIAWFVVTPFLTAPISIGIAMYIGVPDDILWVSFFFGHIVTSPIAYWILKAGQKKT